MTGRVLVLVERLGVRGTVRVGWKLSCTRGRLRVRRNLGGVAFWYLSMNSAAGTMGPSLLGCGSVDLCPSLR